MASIPLVLSGIVRSVVSRVKRLQAKPLTEYNSVAKDSKVANLQGDEIRGGSKNVGNYIQLFR